MKERQKIKVGSTLLSILMALVLLLPVLADAGGGLGRLATGAAPAGPVVMRGAGATGVRAIGGVAFEQSLRKDGNFEILDLYYDATKPNGKRLMVGVNDGSERRWLETQDLYDWEMAEIASFAATEHTAAMTLFGELEDYEYQIEIGNHFDVVNYHPALENTLMGLRMLQADLLLIRFDAVDLFRDDQGRPILGAGEHALYGPDFVKDNSRAWLRLANNVSAIDSDSYIAGDIKTEFHLSARGDRLVIAGDPTWYMWREDRERVDTLRHDLVSEFVVAAEDMDGDLLDQRFSRDYVLQRTLHDDTTIDVLEEETLYVSKLIRSLGGVNPIVYRAVRNMAQYAAIFRGLRDHDPERFERFLTGLPTGPRSPAESTTEWPYVETPTLIEKDPDSAARLAGALADFRLQ